MLIERLIIDGNWIANGYFFKRLDQGLERNEFMPLFRGYAKEAKEVSLVSTTPEDKGGWACLKFTDGKKVFYAQLKYFEEIGFDPEHKSDELDEDEPKTDYTFRLNSEVGMIFIYDFRELLGGVMLVHVMEQAN